MTDRKQKRGQRLPLAPQTPLPHLQEELPEPSSVTSKSLLISPTGRHYRIFQTDQRDATDKSSGPLN
jgi:hypothetical protein